MLAQTFKSAAELGLDKRLYDALVQTYWLLAEGKIPSSLFNMGVVAGPELDDDGTACGAPGCILGWCYAIDRNIGYVRDYELHKLCFPDDLRVYSARADQAARAIHNYLTTGHANWRKALKRA